MILNSTHIPPILKSFGREQKYILKQMAKQDHVIRVVMYHNSHTRDHIQLFDESAQRMRQIVFPELLQAMGRKALFDQETFLTGENVSIVKFRLRKEVKNHFIN